MTGDSDSEFGDLQKYCPLTGTILQNQTSTRRWNFPTTKTNKTRSMNHDQPTTPTKPPSPSPTPKQITSIHTFIQHFINHRLSSSRSLSRLQKWFPFMNHSNFKIIVFLSLAFYAYLKMTRVNPSNVHLWRFSDDFLFSFIGLMKLYYFKDSSMRNNNNKSRSKKFEKVWSDFWLILRLSSFVLLNRFCGGNSHRTLQEDFFFSCSGNLFLAYFFV